MAIPLLYNFIKHVIDTEYIQNIVFIGYNFHKTKQCTMESDDIPLPPIDRKSQPRKTRKECNAEDQQKAVEFCGLLRQACIDRIKTIDNWEPMMRDEEIIKISSMPLPNNFDTSVAYALLRKDFRGRDWVVRRASYILLPDGESAFEIYPVL